MTALEIQIADIVNRETRAWDTQDAGLLVSCFHPAMVWPWPPTAQSHDPMTWVMVWGRFKPKQEFWNTDGGGWWRLVKVLEVGGGAASTSTILHQPPPSSPAHR